MAGEAQLYIWDDTNKTWVKVIGTAGGVLEVSMAVVNLDDLADVYVPAPADGEILYWDETATKWKAKASAAGNHHTTHENGGADEITVLGLSGLLADDQHVLDAEAVSAMGAKADNNPLNHDRYADSEAVAAIKADANFPLTSITFIIDGGGSAITTGIKGFLEIPFDCTINRVTMLADQSGSIVVDIWKDTYANYPPTDADSITAAAPPTITTATKMQDATLTNWITAIAAGNILAFNVDSCTTITRVTISLKVTKT